MSKSRPPNCANQDLVSVFFQFFFLELYNKCPGGVSRCDVGRHVSKDIGTWLPMGCYEWKE